MKSARTLGQLPVLTEADLPPIGTGRWIVARKAIVVAAVRAGLLTSDEACTRYGISLEEFLCWQRLLERHGPRGLRVTRIHQYRKSTEADPVSAASHKSRATHTYGGFQ